MFFLGGEKIGSLRGSLHPLVIKEVGYHRVVEIYMCVVDSNMYTLLVQHTVPGFNLYHEDVNSKGNMRYFFVFRSSPDGTYYLVHSVQYIFYMSYIHDWIPIFK